MPGYTDGEFWDLGSRQGLLEKVPFDLRPKEEKVVVMGPSGEEGLQAEGISEKSWQRFPALVISEERP